MRREAAAANAIFDLPARKWFIPDPAFDFSAQHFHRRAATPLGPAAGPHTQLAQNIVLSWLAGARIIELKTVQVNDRLAIPRPCIHVPNVGYNVEWSQELRVRQSALEYAKAAYLIEILKSTRAFGLLPDLPEPERHYDTVFDISVGYDLSGIRSESVTGFLTLMRGATPLLDECREQLSGDLAEFRDLTVPATISDCVTLSTFHGCPADQIEAIGNYLLEDLGLHTIIKLNPTLLGFERVHDLLRDRLGYTRVELKREAFDQDLQYDQGLEILRNLKAVAETRGSTIGAKFTNTLVVANDPAVFPTQADPYMYLSGQPLHVIAMNLMQRFRSDLGFEFPVSFSAGVDAKNFPAAVACGLVPVTTCTDLLRQGGYGRLPAYLRALGREMAAVGVATREAYVLSARGHGAAAAEEVLRDVTGGLWPREGERLARTARDTPDELPEALRSLARAERLDPDDLVLRCTRVAGRRNGEDLVPALVNERRYHAASNEKAPRRIDSTLGLYDCINCDLCITACPNDAVFAYEVDPVAVETRLIGGVAGTETRGAGYTVTESHQLAVVEGACNECSNCEVYCPEHGAPFVVKERIFLTAADFARCHDQDGFCLADGVLHGRIDGCELTAVFDPVTDAMRVRGGGVEVELRGPSLVVAEGGTTDPDGSFDTAAAFRMRTVWRSIFRADTPNMVAPAADHGAKPPP